MVSSPKHCSLLLESMARVLSVKTTKNPTSYPVGFGKKTDDKKLFLSWRHIRRHADAFSQRGVGVDGLADIDGIYHGPELPAGLPRRRRRPAAGCGGKSRQRHVQCPGCRRKMCAHDRIEVLASLNLAFELPDKAAADAAEAAAADAATAAVPSKTVCSSTPLAGNEVALLSNLLQGLARYWAKTANCCNASARIPLEVDFFPSYFRDGYVGCLWIVVYKTNWN